MLKSRIAYKAVYILAKYRYIYCNIKHWYQSTAPFLSYMNISMILFCTSFSSKLLRTAKRFKLRTTSMRQRHVFLIQKPMESRGECKEPWRLTSSGANVLDANHIYKRQSNQGRRHIVSPRWEWTRDRDWDHPMGWNGKRRLTSWLIDHALLRSVVRPFPYSHYSHYAPSCQLTRSRIGFTFYFNV